jgi:endogenous inhibitor of DNA gyrase (YacG/DUF329 family)
MIKLLCPICQNVMEGRSAAEWPQLPFCSQRCKTIDLGRWLGGDYRIRAEDTEERTDSDEDDLP